MKAFTKRLILFIAWLIGYSRVINRLSRRGLLIVMYHEMEPEKFRQHIEYFKAIFTVMPLREAKRALADGRWQDLPEHALVITFDDAWRSNWNLLPVLREHEVPITIFAPAGLIGTRRKIWNFTLDRESAENDQLKGIPKSQRDEILRQKYRHTSTKEYEERQHLSIEEMQAMVEWVEFQSHGMFHEVLPTCSETELRYELQEPFKILPSITGHDLYAVAYPYGRAGKREQQAAEDAGYVIGRIANCPETNLEGISPMELRAIGINHTATLEDVRQEIVWGEIRGHVRHLIRGLSRG